MRINEQLYVIETPFEVHGHGMTTRAYLILGDYAVLVDSGVASTYHQVVALLRRLRRPLSDLKLIIHTHGHFDHIGADFNLCEASGCLVAAHTAAAPYILDRERQYRRIFESFPEIWTNDRELHDRVFAAMDQGHGVDIWLEEGVSIRPGGGQSLYVYHLPGHSSGQIGLYESRSHVMIIGDAIPSPREGTIGYYEEPTALIKSARRLRALCSSLGVSLLLPAHQPPLQGADIENSLNAQIAAVRGIEWAIWEIVSASGKEGSSLAEVAAAAARTCGRELNSAVLMTCYGHLKDLMRYGVLWFRRERWIASPDGKRRLATLGERG